MKLLTSNSKMKKSVEKVYDFATTAGDSCPFAGQCKIGCFAKTGVYNFPNTIKKHASNLFYTMQSDFVQMMTEEIQTIKKIDALRIHSSGDFYSIEYIEKWIAIAKTFPNIQFYAYTKSVPLFYTKSGRKLIELPRNFTVIFSKGGTHDHMIDDLNLRRVDIVSKYSENSTTSDNDDTIIYKTTNNIELLARHKIGLTA